MTAICKRCQYFLGLQDDTYCHSCRDKLMEELGGIYRSSLPRLPEQWEGPFQADEKRVRCTYGDGYAYGECTIASCASEDEANFIASLLNTCYPAPAEEDGQ